MAFGRDFFKGTMDGNIASIEAACPRHTPKYSLRQVLPIHAQAEELVAFAE